MTNQTLVCSLGLVVELWIFVMKYLLQGKIEVDEEEMEEVEK